MNVTLWIVQGLLAAGFLMAGVMKTTKSRAELKEGGMDWVEGFSDGQVKTIGLLEGLGAIGLILPMLLDIAPVLTPIAATALAVTMVGALITHARNKDPFAASVPSLVLLVLTVFVAIGRF